MDDNKRDSRFESALTYIQKHTGYALKLAIIILFAVFAWRIAWAGFNLDLSKFDFSDLLAMILALFAVGMSVAFYFKTTDSSNLFYDNIYKFTQNTSELLGRIEERFGERLKHLDEGYGKIQSRFEDISKSPKEIEEKVRETEGKEEEEKKKLEATNQAMQKMMEELFNKAEMQELEQQDFNRKLEKLTTERNSAQKRIREIEEDRDRMRMQLHTMDRDMLEGVDGMSQDLLDNIFSHPQMQHLISQGLPPKILQKHFRRIYADFPNDVMMRLHEAGVVNDRKELTAAGALMLRTIARRFFR